MVKVQWLGVLFVALLALQAVDAASFAVDVEPIDNEVRRGEIASFNVTITNFGSEDARFQVYTIDPTWNLQTQPISPVALAGSEVSFLLAARATGGASIGVQGLGVTFKDLVSGNLIRKDVVLSLQSDTPIIGRYEPAIQLNVIMPYEIDPRDPAPVRVELRNRNQLDISNVTIILEGPHFGANFVMPLPPLSERTRDIPGLIMDPLTPPGEAELNVQVLIEGEVITQLEKNYKITEYTTVRERVSEESVFFKTTRTITVTNEGNVVNTAIVSIPASLLKGLFISSDRIYERTAQDGMKVILWSIPLRPDESATFRYTTNYRVLILIFVMALIGLIAYWFMRSPVIVIKEAVGLSKKEGASVIKVRIFVRNRSAKLVRNLQVTDRVPSLADVVKAEAPGSIAPSKIAVSEKKGTLLRWQLDTLEPYEERVLTYQAKSKLKIIGRMSLPNAKTRFVVNGRERAIYSNNLDIVERFKDQ